MSHITIAASANAFGQLFKAVRDNFTFAKSDTGDFGPFFSQLFRGASPGGWHYPVEQR